jgi:hypothetical protein
VLAGVMLWLRRKRRQYVEEDGRGSDHGDGLGVQDVVTGLFILALIGGAIAFATSGGTS